MEDILEHLDSHLPASRFPRTLPDLPLSLRLFSRSLLYLHRLRKRIGKLCRDKDAWGTPIPVFDMGKHT